MSWMKGAMFLTVETELTNMEKDNYNEPYAMGLELNTSV